MASPRRFVVKGAVAEVLMEHRDASDLATRITDAVLEAVDTLDAIQAGRAATCDAVHPDSTPQFTVTPCRRSPGHLGPHRDAKQKGTERYSWEPQR